MACVSCGRGFHNECDNGCSNCHPYVDIGKTLTVIGNGRGQPLKNVEDIKDPYSTGRKRAATQYPIFKTNPCEWRGKKNCGGGLKPIIGCIKGLQQDAHHGPIKNTLRNEPGNVHRICKICHARWHTFNDPEYDEMRYENLPHRPELATDLELLANESYWKLKK
jgi:hypothetical protein